MRPVTEPIKLKRARDQLGARALSGKTFFREPYQLSSCTSSKNQPTYQSQTDPPTTTPVSHQDMGRSPFLIYK